MKPTKRNKRATYLFLEEIGGLIKQLFCIVLIVLLVIAGFLFCFLRF